MLSPATFIGIANATAPAIPPPARPAAQPANTLVQPVRALGIQPLGPQSGPPGGAKPPAAASPAQPAAPPRNLPRGSLLDLSV